MIESSILLIRDFVRFLQSDLATNGQKCFVHF